jgi:hypothetical protein
MVTNPAKFGVTVKMHVIQSDFVSVVSELVRNKTLEFFSKTLPILKADETLPRVAKYHQDPDQWSTSSLAHNSYVSIFLEVTQLVNKFPTFI